MIPRRAAVRRLLAAAGLIATLAVWSAAPAAADGPGDINLTTTSVKVGQIIPVSLDGWPAGLVTVTVCGNSAKRGSPDCNLNATAAVAVVAGASSSVNLTIGEPPVPCPCVLRAATRQNDAFRTVPIQIEGVPVEGVPEPSEPLAVSVGFVDDPGRSFVDTVRALLGGPARRMLRVRLHNNTSQVMSTLSLQVVVGPNRDEGNPVDPPVVQPLAPGADGVYDLPITIEAPSWGDRKAYGSVYGLPQPVAFEASTSSTPWLLYALGPVLVADVVAWRMVRRRRRAAARAASLQPAELQETSRETEGEHTRRAPIPSLSAQYLP